MACDRSVAETIETMTERLQTSTLLDDRRGACRGLRNLARHHRVEVGAQSMEPLLQTTKIDEEDTEMKTCCFESINYIINGPLGDSPAGTWPYTDTNSDSSNPVTPSNNQHININSNIHNSHETVSSNNKAISHDPGLELSEIFLKKADHVEVLISNAVNESDFRIRCLCVRILCGLARHKLAMLQEHLCRIDLGVSRLTQLITEEQELIRNDALVLFVRLTQSNQNIQNLLAFNDCFDKLMYIIELESYLDGTVAVVMDCLNIILNSTQCNEKNQILFREGGHIQKLMPFIDAVQTIQWTQEKTTCLVLVLRILGSMLSVTNSAIDVHACRSIMLRCGLLDKLCGLLTATAMPIDVCSETMDTASDIVPDQWGPNANMVMQTSSMMPVLLLSQVKKMCQALKREITELHTCVQDLRKEISSNKQDYEKKISELYNYIQDQERRHQEEISEINNYQRVLHDFLRFHPLLSSSNDTSNK